MVQLECVYGAARQLTYLCCLSRLTPERGCRYGHLIPSFGRFALQRGNSMPQPQYGAVSLIQQLMCGVRCSVCEVLRECAVQLPCSLKNGRCAVSNLSSIRFAACSNRTAIDRQTVAVCVQAVPTVQEVQTVYRQSVCDRSSTRQSTNCMPPQVQSVQTRELDGHSDNRARGSNEKGNRGVCTCVCVCRYIMF